MGKVFEAWVVNLLRISFSDRLRHYKPHQQVLSPSADSFKKILQAKVEEMDAKDYLEENLEEKSSGCLANTLVSRCVGDLLHLSLRRTH